jgi:hypothetical protein
MSILSTLTAADERLAGQLDKVTDSLSGIGGATNAARKRLALALDAARARLAGALADVEALAGELCADLLAAAGEDLLAVPAHQEQHESAPAPCDCGRDYCLVCNGSLSVAVSATYDNEVKDYHEDAVKGGTEAGLPPDNEPEPVESVNRVAELAFADRTPEAVDESMNSSKSLDALCDKGDAMRANGRAKKRRR